MEDVKLLFNESLPLVLREEQKEQVTWRTNPKGEKTSQQSYLLDGTLISIGVSSISIGHSVRPG